MKKIILTGASGFIGRHTIPLLLRQNYQVHAISRNRKPLVNDDENLIWHQCDLLNTKERKNIFETVEATHLLHLAWNVNHKTYLSSPENTSWVTVSMDMVKDFKNNHGRRVVSAGTCFEYDPENKIYCEQTARLKAFSLYGESKIRLYEMLRDYANEQKISYAWGRIFFLYGPFEQPTRLVPSIILSLLQNKIACCLRGNLVRDFLYVEDVASAFVSLLEGDIIGPVNVSSCQPCSLGDIVNIIAEKLNKKELVRIEENPCSSNEPLFLATESTRLSNETSWIPKYNLEQGLELTINWWKNNLTTVMRTNE